jgi:hypothetical protein
MGELGRDWASFRCYIVSPCSILPAHCAGGEGVAGEARPLSQQGTCVARSFVSLYYSQVCFQNLRSSFFVTVVRQGWRRRMCVLEGQALRCVQLHYLCFLC